MTDVSPSPPYTVAFPISSFFPSSFLFFLRFTVADGGSLIDGGKMFSPEPTPGRLFGRPAFLRKFIQRCCASLRSMLHLSRCNAIPPRQDGRAPGRIRGNFPRTQSWISCFSVFMHFYWSYFIDRAKLCIVARRGKLIWELLSIDRNSIEIIFNYPRIPSFEILLRTWPSGQRQVRCVMYLCP